MDGQIRLLAAANGLLHLVIGFSELFSNAIMEHRASAWQVLYSSGLPIRLWALAFVVVGVIALVAAWLDSPSIGRSAFRVSALLFTAWGIGSAVSYVYGYGATLGGTLQLGYVAALQAGIAQYVTGLDSDRERPSEDDTR